MKASGPPPIIPSRIFLSISSLNSFIYNNSGRFKKRRFPVKVNGGCENVNRSSCFDCYATATNYVPISIDEKNLNPVADDDTLTFTLPRRTGTFDLRKSKLLLRLSSNGHNLFSYI